ncbi:MAG: gas vesicle protein [Ignavibacteria bacterium]|nr:gas vesicle protein [Ignavibacteria bacterium]NCS81748.1 gas vesicle protein [Ignavibacteria bacterium]OIO22588.1 MAG: gas vesicle protein [Ignavibacteria bacterium CG1_02_37_35]PIX94622.1 MAG: gas vesicle protein [Ignavibacteria bacterium CG_4_10_14_3_um_filter_37_18]PJC58941.1 MAG: gas vesicle protein [Ignavibacteria bacterium CG_4_9_14_0_2_um_filter_37_13]
MSTNESNISKGLLIGFLTGGIVGAALALLYAPKSGKELRQDIKGKADELLDEAEKYLDVAKEKASNIYNDGKKKSELLIADAKVKADVLIKDAEKVFTDAKQKAGQAISTGKETVATESDKIKNAFKAGVDAYKDAKKS